MDCWQVLGRSVRGAAHIRSGLPNQDAIGWIENMDAAGGLLLAVADGHGSAKCFRSDCGARLAVQVATSVLGQAGADSEKALENLIRNWREAVENHLREDPIPASALFQLERKFGMEARRALEANPVLAYGSTLLVAAVSDSGAQYMQLGDGDILTVSAKEEVSRLWVKEEHQLGDETASLVTRGAAGIARQTTCPVDGLPELIVLATDGYANSFRDDAGFLEVGRDLLRVLQIEGIDPVDQNLEAWLREASELGSGDDITVGILWRNGRSTGQC
jgi:serine/threonine protein phosphatase PrpC